MSQDNDSILIPVTVTFNSATTPPTNPITFSGPSPTVTPVDGGSRAVIEVPFDNGERLISLTLQGEGVAFPTENAVQWHKQPRWAEVRWLSATKVLISDTWQSGDQPTAAKFTVNVLFGGKTQPSLDPTIINNPENP